MSNKETNLKEKLKQALTSTIRVISDNANENSSEDFSKVLIKYNYHSAKLISALIENIESLPN